MTLDSLYGCIGILRILEGSERLTSRVTSLTLKGRSERDSSKVVSPAHRLATSSKPLSDIYVFVLPKMDKHKEEGHKKRGMLTKRYD